MRGLPLNAGKCFAQPHGSILEVGDGGAVGLADAHLLDPDRALVHLLAHPAVDGAGEHFAGGIDLLKLRQFREVAVIVLFEQRIELLLEFAEIQRDADPVKFIRTDRDGDPVVVTVQIAAVPVVAAQLMCGGKTAFDFDFEHEFTS